jgi:hypothetical protein
MKYSTKDSVKNILMKAYGRQAAGTELILNMGGLTLGIFILPMFQTTQLRHLIVHA